MPATIYIYIFISTMIDDHERVFQYLYLNSGFSKNFPFYGASTNSEIQYLPWSFIIFSEENIRITRVVSNCGPFTIRIISFLSLNSDEITH